MDLHKIFDETVSYFKIQGKELAQKAGRTPGNISEIRKGKVGIVIRDFGDLLETCEELAPGFKAEFGRRLVKSHLEINDLSLGEILSQIDSGRLSDDEVANLSADLAELFSAISRRLKIVAKV